MLRQLCSVITIRFLVLLALTTGSQCSGQDESLFRWCGGDPIWESPAVEYERLTSDRPHISEATSTVGLGRIQLETGYTLARDSAGGDRFRSYSYPEPLLRIGVLREWLEFRIATNYLNQVESDSNSAIRSRGFDDMYLGAKVALVKQSGVLPDLTIFPQMRVPTGASSLTGGRVLPGVNIAYSWALSRRVELECNTVFSSKVEDQKGYADVLQTANFEFDLGPRCIYFTEFYCFQPMSTRPNLETQAYFHTGTQYFLRPELQLDVHAAVGLNAAADNLSNTGCGLCVRW